MSQFLKNLSVVIKILVPVSVLGIMLFVIGGVGLLSSTNIMNESNEISENYISALEYVGEIQGAYQSMRRVAYAHIVASNANNTEMIGSLEAEGEELKNEILAEIEAYGATIKVQAQKEALDQFASDFDAYAEVWQTILNLSRGYQVGDASKMANGSLRDKGIILSESLTALSDSIKKGVDIATSNQKATFEVSRITVLVLIVLGALILAFTCWICWTWCCKRLININRQLRSIIQSVEEGRGDLTKRVQCFCTDEVGNVAAGINIFIETLHKIMGQINVSSGQLGNIVQVVSGKVDTANLNSVDISSVMEQLSASMEEISSTVSDIKDSVEEIDVNIVELSTESQNLHDYANEMQKRAEDLEKSAVENRRTTGEVIDGIVTSLRKAIEDSRSVEKVNDLTNEILNISSQTNLLSLNASIEAARAGEAGRGFAVVAGEISQLANSSREAASNIQNINNMVVKAVNELIASSDNMVRYINENILPDYENFVGTGRQYSDDAVHVNETVTKFNDMSGEIRDLMQNIMNAVNGITSAVDESANGVTNAAMNTSDLVRDIGEIATAMKDNKQVAGTLEEEADRFINLDMAP